MNSASDLERKMESALAARLKQHAPLAKMRFRRTSEDSAKVNEDIVISAQRREGNPPFSGVYNLEITATLSMRHRKTVDSLPQSLALCKSLEEVFHVPTYTLAAQVSACAPDFHCYEIAIIDKDDAPQGQKHSCVWKLSAIAMAQTFANADKLNNPTK